MDRRAVKTAVLLLAAVCILAALGRCRGSFSVSPFPLMIGGGKSGEYRGNRSVTRLPSAGRRVSSL